MKQKCSKFYYFFFNSDAVTVLVYLLFHEHFFTSQQFNSLENKWKYCKFFAYTNANDFRSMPIRNEIRFENHLKYVHKVKNSHKKKIWRFTCHPSGRGSCWIKSFTWSTGAHNRATASLWVALLTSIPFTYKNVHY